MGQVKLRLIREEPTPEVKKTEDNKPKFKSALAGQMDSFANELDKKIAAILAD